MVISLVCCSNGQVRITVKIQLVKAHTVKSKTEIVKTDGHFKKCNSMLLKEESIFLFVDFNPAHLNLLTSLISKIGLHRATHCCDEPVLKPIGGHLEKTTQSSVFVSKSYFEASEIGLECSQCFFRQLQT